MKYTVKPKTTETETTKIRYKRTTIVCIKKIQNTIRDVS